MQTSQREASNVLTTLHLFLVFLIIIASVTRFGEISPLWQNIKSVCQFFEASYSAYNDF